MKYTNTSLGAIFILRNDIGVGGPENGNFPLIYVLKMSLHKHTGTFDSNFSHISKYYSKFGLLYEDRLRAVMVVKW